MEMSLSQAAQAAKRTRQCLALAIKKGRLAAVKDASGEWKVDTAELVRVYPNCNLSPQPAPQSEQVLDTELAVEVAILRERLTAAEALRKKAEDRADELRRDLDAERERFDNYVRALPAGKPPDRPVVALQAAPQPEGQDAGQKPRKRSFWRSIFGGGGSGE